MADLFCPKCGAPMRPFRRDGVAIDECVACRGLFLDRGELERFTAWEPRATRDPYDDDDDDTPAARRRERPRRRTFIDNLFDVD